MHIKRFTIKGGCAFVILVGSAAMAADAPLLDEHFSGPLDPHVWSIPTHDPKGDGTLIGRTQFRVTQDSALPVPSGGAVCMPIETYGSRPNAFFGAQIITRQEFSVGAGLDIQIHARMTSAEHRGIVGGMFLYSLKPGSDTLHDEIDFELLTNIPDQVETNIYGDEPLGDGHPQAIPFGAGAITGWHTYEVEWKPDRVSWLVDGTIVRTTTANVPTRPMNLYLNVWAPDHWWPLAYSDSIQPASSEDADSVLGALCVDHVLVRTLLK